MSKIKSINPSTYKLIAEIEETSKDEIARIVQTAQNTKKDWASKPLNKRISALKNVFDLFSERKHQYAELAAKEMGMPKSHMEFEIEDGFHYAKWYFDNAEKYLKPETIKHTDDTEFVILREPHGVGVSILPWNFPFSNFVWGTIQALISGNVMIMKLSEQIPMCSQFIDQVFQDVNFPKGVFRVIVGNGRAGDFLTDQQIDFINFTGSTKVGKYLYKKAGEKFIPAFMELGGSAPGIVFEDANLDEVVESVNDNRLFNCGQICDGLKRLIVHESVYDELIDRLKQLFESQIVGNALDNDTTVGPLVSETQLRIVEQQVENSVQSGAEVIIGGENFEEELGGAFYAPTLLTNIKNDMPVWKEEVFGPVLPVVKFNNYEEALDLANSTQYGLGGYVFTEDEDVMDKVSKDLNTGMLCFNGTSYLDPVCPFGGMKDSGLGRQHGKFGFDEMTKVKAVVRPS